MFLKGLLILFMKKYIRIGIVGLLVLSVALVISQMNLFSPESASKELNSKSKIGSGPYKTAIFAGGCFWSLESYFEKAPVGIVKAVSGYSGGKSTGPTYQNYLEGGHREVVEVTYDPTWITYGELVEYYFRHIDPTDATGSFYDRGIGYTSAIYYDDKEEKDLVEEIITLLETEKIFKKPIVTLVLPRSEFWSAEEYHQDYAKNNSSSYTAYRIGSGRDAFLKKTWEGAANPLYIKKVTL